MSPSFLVWFCKTVDLSGCTAPMSITLTECNTTSIKCLDSLGIQKLRGLVLEELANLAVLDCQLITKISPSGVGALELWHLPVFTEVPEHLAKLLAEKRWKKVCMDMRIWNEICSQAKKSMEVATKLWLNVRDLKELDPDKVWVAGTTLCVQGNNVTNKPTYTTVFKSVLKWLVGGGEKTKIIESIRVSSTDWDWNTNPNEQKAQSLAKMVSESEEWHAMLKQKTLYINNTPVHIPELTRTTSIPVPP
ncbi:hypothetical protein NEDG_02244 [Nematocida displodere]|uniref:Uncharacterized protein n=1 Tax=Nematocida displodere TaxID=1805483 RepID=A0A177EEJ5_9MICR|nr:hypothetical protein NEDG_02244 [Nematocida displodere]